MVDVRLQRRLAISNNFSRLNFLELTREHQKLLEGEENRTLWYFDLQISDIYCHISKLTQFYLRFEGIVGADIQSEDDQGTDSEHDPPYWQQLVGREVLAGLMPQEIKRQEVINGKKILQIYLLGFEVGCS